MKILYDHQTFSNQKYGGVSRYFSEVMKNLPAEHQEFSLSVFITNNQYLKENRSFFRKRYVSFLKKERMYNINKTYSKKFIAAGKYDLFHPTFYDDYFFDIVKTPFIVTVHDLILFKYKDIYYRNLASRHIMEERVIRSANRLIAVSKNTKKDLVEIFQISPDKIDVVYHGFNEEHINRGDNKYGSFILFVGRRGDYKNFKIFAKAISLLFQKEKDLKLVCAGIPFNKEEEAELKGLGILDKTIAIGADEKSLSELYSHAIMFVYPSMYEGFGIPILEAYAHDCPVCLSDTSCFPEIAVDAGVYFDPLSEESILSAMSRVLHSSGLREALVKKGRERLKDFSWQKCAHETVVSYRTTLEY